jgi:DNA-directed RNA polymerase subunit L/DNA-directed RNA polymerase alpha subunit
MTTETVFKNLATVIENPNMLTFQLAPANVAYANTLRRMVLIGVESVAFRADMNEKGETTDVTVLENTTPMTNEMLADRIGQIPIHADPLTWNPDEYKFELKIENDSPDTLPVKAEHFDVRKQGGDGENSLVGNKQFFHPDRKTGDTTLIALLKAKQPAQQTGQKIHLIAKATVGIGRDHIRFSPVSQCSYGYTIDTDEARQQIAFEKWIQASKNKRIDDLKDKEELKTQLKREFETMEIQRCYVKDPITGEANSFEFTVESIGVMPATWIVNRALENIITKLSKYTTLDRPSEGENTGNESVTVQPADARMKGFDFIFQKEDHTLGNLLQTYMDETMMNKDITFVGYKVPHPLRDEMVLRVGMNFPMDVEKDGKESAARFAVAKAATECVTMFQKWREDWILVTNATKGTGQRSLNSLRLTAANAKAFAQAASANAKKVSGKVNSK